MIERTWLFALVVSRKDQGHAATSIHQMVYQQAHSLPGYRDPRYLA